MFTSLFSKTGRRSARSPVRQAALNVVESLETRRLFAGYEPTPLLTVTDTASPAESEAFGTTLAARGNQILVAKPLEEQVLLINADTGATVETFDTSDIPVGVTGFGTSVAFVGAQKIAIGAADNGAGRVYVYDNAGDTTPREILAGGNTNFGRRLVGYHEQLLISGDGYLGRYDTSVATEAIPEVATYADTVNGGTFGDAIVVTGDDHLLIGADDITAFTGGYVVEIDAVTGNVIDTYDAPSANDFSFGDSLAVSGGNFFVSSLDTQTVHQFAQGASTPNVTYANPADPFSSFGARLAVSGNELIIGAPTTFGSSAATGSVFVYQIGNSSTFSELSNPTPEAGNNETFGDALAVLGNGNLVVADPGQDVGGRMDAGAVYVFQPASDAPEAVTATVDGSGNLVVTGTSGGETIEIRAAATAGVDVYVDGALLGTFAPSGTIIVNGAAGNDVISVAGDVQIDADLHGGDGHDTITGGGGNDLLTGDAGDDQLISRNASDILLGGLGNDTVLGGNGRDLLIGGDGADVISGDNAEDILVAGSTAHDDDRTALEAIRTEWNSGSSRDVRIANLQGSLLSAGNIVADSFVDSLYGGSGMDFFLVDAEGEALDIKRQET